MRNVRQIIILYPGETSSDRINKPANYALSRMLIELHKRGDVPVTILNRSPRHEQYGNIQFVHFTLVNFLKLLLRTALDRNALIISQTGAYPWCAVLLRLLMPGSRVVVRLGGVYYGRAHLESDAFSTERYKHRRRLSVADVVVCTADGTPVDLYMAKVGIPPDRYRKWLNGFPVVDNYGPFQRANRIVCISRLSHEKAIDYVIRSFAAALPRLSARHRLSIVGDGPELESLRQLARDLGVESDVEFPGYSRDIGRHLYSSKLLVSGLANNTVIEAIATGTPVVAVELGEMRALYGHLPNVHIIEYPGGGYGRIPPDYIECLVRDTADAIVTVLNDYPTDAVTRRPAPEGLYSWEQRLQDELDLYEDLIGGGAPDK